MNDNILDSFPVYNLDFVSIAWVFKLLFLVLLAGIVLYTVLLSLRVRILSDTVQTPFNSYVKGMTALMMLVIIAGSVLSLAIILVA